MQRITIVDDDVQIGILLQDMLETEGFNVVSYRDPQTALNEVEARAPDLVILDINMPKMNGIELLRRLRKKSDVPVIFLTGRLAEADELTGLQVGADAYIRKPFSQRILIERVRTVLRRARASKLAPEAETNGAIIERGDLHIDKERYTCTWKKRTIVLTLTEFRLLEALTQRTGVIQTRDALKAMASGDQVHVDDRTIDSHIKRLRKKFREVDATFDRIEALYGVGYRFRE
jgi:two-component system, OmpR family, response regulator ChvI